MGPGAPQQAADVGVKDGKVVEVGRVSHAPSCTVDAMCDAGFVDIHTHYAAPGNRLNPSSHHGVTTVVMGNCGVGFSPPGARQMMTCSYA